MLIGKLTKIPFVHNLITVPDSKTEALRGLVAVRGNVALAFLCVAVASLLMPGARSSNSLFIIAICCAFIAVNGIYDRLLKGEISLTLLTFLRESLIPLDVLLITLCIYVTGGALSPVLFAYSVGILLSIILLDPKGVYRTAGISILCYCCLSFLEAFQIIPYISDYWGGPDLHKDATFVTYALYLLVVCSMLLAQAYIGNRIALIINQRNSRIDSQMRDLNTLYNIAGGLGNVMNEHEIARYLANTLKTLQNASLCVVSLVNKDGKPEIAASTGLTPAEVAALSDSDRETPGIRNLLERGEPLVIEELSKRPDYRNVYLPGRNINSVYVYPALAKGNVLGAICLAFEETKSLSQEYRNLLTTISNQTGMALQRARLFSDAQRLAHEMSTLYDIGLYTGSTLSRSEVVKRTADNIEKLMSADMFYIALFDEQTQIITVELCKDAGQVMPKLTMPLERGGLTGRIITTREPLLVRDWLEDGQQYNTLAHKVGTEMLSYLGVPMLFDGKVTGVLSIQSTHAHAFNRHDQRLLQAMAAQTAMALENATLHQIAQTGAITDSLTGVYNHGHFVDQVYEAVAASDREDSQVSLIMLDIDHFKQYNDRYGHVAGDNVLAMVGALLKQSVRDTDAVGRWGGEEFGVLLRGAGAPQAKKVARTIRRAIAELAPLDGRGSLIQSPTVSQGISTYPFPSAGATHLIEQADAALYHAKEHGRNQLVVAEATGTLKEATDTSPRLPNLEMKNATVTTSNLKN
jgi:diguanylate cyclase (GGDEF)-like protein